MGCNSCQHKKLLDPANFPPGHLWRDYCHKAGRRIPFTVHVGMFPYPEWCPEHWDDPAGPWKEMDLTEEQRLEIRKLLVGTTICKVPAWELDQMEKKEDA